MQMADLDAVVEIHQRAFPGFFLTRMGSSFLLGYYRSALDFSSIALLACDENSGETLGFAVGFRDPQAFYQFFSRRRRRLAPAILMAMLRDPRLIYDIVRNARRVETQSRQVSGSVELSSIAVARGSRGVGGALLEAFVEQARIGDARELFLTTDADSNEDVRRFYERRGFVLQGYEDRGNRRLCRYVRSLA